MSLPKPPPVSLSQIPEGWAEMVREIIVRDGNALRASPITPSIEVKSLITNKWHPLGLPGGGTTFVSYGDRNFMFHKLQGK